MKLPAGFIRNWYYRITGFLKKDIQKKNNNRFYGLGLNKVFHFLPETSEPVPLHIISFTYNNELLIQHQRRLLDKYLTDRFVLVIADNSPDPAKRELIKKFCMQNNTGYISMPDNPYGIGSNSHGVCINWI